MNTCVYSEETSTAWKGSATSRPATPPKVFGSIPHVNEGLISAEMSPLLTCGILIHRAVDAERTKASCLFPFRCRRLVSCRCRRQVFRLSFAAGRRVCRLCLVHHLCPGRRLCQACLYP